MGRIQERSGLDPLTEASAAAEARSAALASSKVGRTWRPISSSADCRFAASMPSRSSDALDSKIAEPSGVRARLAALCTWRCPQRASAPHHGSCAVSWMDGRCRVISPGAARKSKSAPPKASVSPCLERYTARNSFSRTPQATESIRAPRGAQKSGQGEALPQETPNTTQVDLPLLCFHLKIGGVSSCAWAAPLRTNSTQTDPFHKAVTPLESCRARVKPVSQRPRSAR